METYYEVASTSQEHLIERAEQLSYEALAEVAYRYGSGFEGDMHEPTVQDLAFHNLQHSWRAKDTSGAIARKMGLSEYDARLAELISAAHDVIHEPSDTQSAEELSANWLVTRMQAEGFPEEDQDIARFSIFGTIAELDHENGYILQKFRSLGMFAPSMRAYNIALCVAGADMETFISSYGAYNSHQVFKEEIVGVGWGEKPTSLEKFAGFQEFQIKLNQNFLPLHPVIETIFEPLRGPVIAHHKAILDDVLAGQITTWEEIEERDLAFGTRMELAASNLPN
jgi:hypothetical protein